MTTSRPTPAAESVGTGTSAEKSTLYERRWKRLLDVLLSLLLIAVCIVPMIAIGVINLILYRRLFFVATRVGKDGRRFFMVKFWTMEDETPTRFGAFLRHTALDETPQFFHVLLGTMSLVGPRPHTEEQYERLSAICGYSARLAQRPGMTGLAQLRGHYDCDETRADLVRSDAEYLEKCSFWFDLGILLRTLAVPFTGH